MENCQRKLKLIHGVFIQLEVVELNLPFENPDLGRKITKNDVLVFLLFFLFLLSAGNDNLTRISSEANTKIWSLFSALGLLSDFLWINQQHSPQKGQRVYSKGVFSPSSLIQNSLGLCV